MPELNNFSSMLIGLASPEKIREWSHGEVKKPETINYRTLKPEKDGLFCERIFGPTKDWECHCGKYKRIRYKGIICDKCGVEVTRSKVRRERMGHIELAAPVSHIWYFKGTPSRMGLMLDMSPRLLDRVLYFAAYIVVDPGETPLMRCQVLSEREYHEAVDSYGAKSFRAGMGAEAIKELLQQIDVGKLAEELRTEADSVTGQKRLRLVKRLEVVEAFNQSGNSPTWMVMDVVPVIPPELRPMVQLDGDRFATSDLNDLYRRVINRNNRLKRLLELGAPDIIVRNEKRMLQEAVDALIDNGRRGKAVTGPGNRPLKSLSDMLRGKQGRFRQNLLGKRVDYSGRSVIVVGPDLKMYQCGLPKEMALELFKPFVMKKLVSGELAQNIKGAKRMVESAHPKVWDVLEDVISEHPVLLNRAPTLHRLGIQAFEPVLVEGRAIRLHPLVCKAFNADFDGDQMAVHVPLSVEAQAEARFLMLSAHNILKPQDGKPVTVPTQDMILGAYYLTVVRPGAKGECSVFSDTNEAIRAYQTGAVDLQAQVKVMFERTWEGEVKRRLTDTTVGFILFNEAVPQDIGFVDRTDPDNLFVLEIHEKVDSDRLGQIVDKCYHAHGPTRTCEVLDNVKRLGYMYSTRGALTVSVMDIKVPEKKKEILEEAEKAVAKTTRQYRRGMISEESRYNDVVEIWTNATNEVTAALKESMDPFNPIYMMANSGARGNMNQIRQLAGMRGLMANPSGKVIELPIRANFREGLNVLEFFISSHGTRKGMADTALKTADSGYLTRRLVDVSQDVIVNEIDCYERAGETPRGIEIGPIMNGTQVVESLAARILGRVAVGDIVDPRTGEVIVADREIISGETGRQIEDAGIKSVAIRSVLTCRSHYGVCARCYGANLATGRLVDIGEAVGIIAAQSIGEPGTQLTMRTFHTGGVAASDDITQGLPRVEELFEARKPKGQAVITEISGTVSFDDSHKRNEVSVAAQDGELKTYLIPYGSKIRVTEGQHIEAGDELTEGSVNPHDILTIRGIKGVQSYLLREVQMVYRLQGVSISDKHIEVIVRQMLRKVKIEDAGDTELLPGGLVDIFVFEEQNEAVLEKGGRPAVAKRVLLGITKAALATDSFLSAASFQETTRVLTEAAIKGKTDELMGLKENVIIGKLIPAGTGMRRYRDIRIETDADTAMGRAFAAVRTPAPEAQADDMQAPEETPLEATGTEDALTLDLDAFDPDMDAPSDF